jgi:8-oxo-dGTP pyrophosphatase MutT (NUDIX family)
VPCDNPAVDERPLRRAASAIVGRAGADGLEVLVVRRASASRFLAGYVTFPGGAIDEADPELASRWLGDPAEAARAAAVRELVEEVGLALTREGLVAGGLDAVDAGPPATTQLPQVARWIAPGSVPVRFDAAYFAAAAPADLDPVPDGRETHAAWWSTPRRLIGEWQEGARKLYWPTYFTVLHLLGCSSVEDLLALSFEAREPTADEELALPASVFEEV